MHPVVAFQLLAGPIVVHQLTRPLAALIRSERFDKPEEEVVAEMIAAWLRAMAPEETR